MGESVTCKHCDKAAVWEVAAMDDRRPAWVSACDAHVGKVIDSLPRKVGAVARGVVVER